MECKVVSITPPGLLRSITNVFGNPEYTARLDTTVIRIDGVLRPLETIALVKLCGSRNIILHESGISTDEEVRSDINIPHEMNLLSVSDDTRREFVDKPAKIPWMYRYYKVSTYFTGTSILNLCDGMPCNIIDSEGVVNVDKLISGFLLPAIYSKTFNEMISMKKDFRVRNLSTYKNARWNKPGYTLYYVTNGMTTLDFSSSVEAMKESLQAIQEDISEFYSATVVGCINLHQYVDLILSKPGFVDILEEDGLCSVIPDTITSDDVRVLMLAILSASEADTTIHVVLRIRVTNDNLSEMERLSWADDNLIAIVNKIRILGLPGIR